MKFLNLNVSDVHTDRFSRSFSLITFKTRRLFHFW